jgi:hypothetical protein
MLTIININKTKISPQKVTVSFSWRENLSKQIMFVEAIWIKISNVKK